MLISKFDLYKTEWLDLVFDDRNKSYGAYELRQHYPRTMVRAMVITFLSIGAAALIAGVLIKPVVAAVTPVMKIIPVSVIKIIHPPVLQPPSHAAAAHARAALPAITPSIVHPSIPVVTPDKLVTTPVKLNTSPDPGPVTIDSKGPVGPSIDPGPAGPPSTSSSTEVHSPFGLERMPEPFGGTDAWNKFLQKNLKYPDMAADQHMSGAVWVSFIVEADGKLSNIKIQRGAGYGMDEEAIRVIKAAPAWRPGIQNGQPVRVSYNIPIRFVLGDDNN